MARTTVFNWLHRILSKRSTEVVAKDEQEKKEREGMMQPGDKAEKKALAQKEEDANSKKRKAPSLIETWRDAAQIARQSPLQSLCWFRTRISAGNQDGGCSWLLREVQTHQSQASSKCRSKAKSGYPCNGLRSRG